MLGKRTGRRSRRAEGGAPGGPDSGNVQVLEVTVAGIALVGAALTVHTMSASVDQAAPAPSGTAQHARDLLDVVAAQEAPDNASANLLAHEVAQAIQGDPVLRDHVNRHFPNKDWSLVLRNAGGSAAEVESDGDPFGPVTTAERPLVPRWTYSWEGARMGVYSGEHPMQVASVPVHNSRTARLPGEPVKVTVAVEENGEEKRYHAYETVGRAEGGSPTATVIGVEERNTSSVGFSTGYLETCRSSVLHESTELECDFELGFHLIEWRNLGPGTRLELDVPKDWKFRSLQRPDRVWDIQKPPEDTWGPFTLVARVEAGATIEDGDTLMLTLNTTADPSAPFSTFEARLGNGTLSRGEVVVPHPGAEAKAPRAVYTSLPYPGAAGGTERWGLGFSNGLSEATITEFTVESVSGTPLFDGVSVVESLARNCVDAVCGEVRVEENGTRIAWSGSETIMQGETRDVILDVDAADGTTRVSEAERRSYPTVAFGNGYEHRLTRQMGAPGIYTHRVPPESGDATDTDLDAGNGSGDDPDGYPTGDGIHRAELEYYPRGELWKVDSTFRYTVESGPGAEELAFDTQGALAESRVTARPSRTSPGKTVWARVNASNVLSTAADHGAEDVSMTARLYSPPTLGEEAVHTIRTNLTGDGVGKGVTAVLAADATGDGVPEAILGARDRQVHAYAVDPASLAPTSLWSKDVGARPTALAAGADGSGTRRVYVGAADGTVRALGPAGAQAWSVETGAYPVSRLEAVDADGDGATDVLWAAAAPDDAQGATSEGLRWHRISVAYTETGPEAALAGSGTAGGTAGAVAELGGGLATAVSSAGPAGAPTWVNATGPAGRAEWSHRLAPGLSVVDVVAADVTGDGREDVAAALDRAQGLGALVLFDGREGAEIDRVLLDDPRTIRSLGDVKAGAGAELAVATGGNDLGLLSGSDDGVGWLWRTWIATAPRPGAGPIASDGPCSLSWPRNPGESASCILTQAAPGRARHKVRTPTMGGPGASWIPLPVIQAGATPVPVGLELVDPPASEPQLALAYTWGRVPAGAAPGSVVRYDLADGSRRDSTPFPPDAGVPVAADGDALPWMAVGTDRGHLVVTDGSGPTLRHAQVSEDRTRFLFPIAVGEDAFYGTYVFDAEIGWSPDALDARQSAHLVSRFSVLPELGVGRGGFVYDTELSVGDPAEG